VIGWKVVRMGARVIAPVRGCGSFLFTSIDDSSVLLGWLVDGLMNLNDLAVRAFAV